MHFFIDHNGLTIDQDETQSFGPAFLAPSVKYNLTSKFEISASAKAFACQSGMLVAQKSTAVDGGGLPLVNIIIKPTDTLFSTGIKVAYYIYRGISLGSLISSDGTKIIAQDDATNNQLVTRIYSVDKTKVYSSGYLG